MCDNPGMRYLIDGYNLLFAVGRLNRHSGKAALEGARAWLQSQIQRFHGTMAANVTVVYDGEPGRRGAEAGAVFSFEIEADDIIEQRVRQESNPRRLTVVSDDRRVREAARRKGCAVLHCLDYVEKHLLSAPAVVSELTPEKPLMDPSQDWELFKHLEDDPEFKSEDWPW
jgi:predicted RNA-binding protein with PIN domain